MYTDSPVNTFALRVEKKLDNYLFEKLAQLIDPEKRERIRRFRKWEDAHRGLFADLLVRKIMSSEKKMKNEDIAFELSEYGKPALKNNPGYHFNVSHSGTWVVCALDSNLVGIDIELIDDIDLSISENYFCPKEHAHIVAHHSPKDKFFEYWALKESYIKFIGKGLSQPLNSFGIKYLNEKAVGIELNESLLPNVHFWQYNIDEAYKMAVCATHSGFAKDIKIYNAEDIIAYMLQTVSGRV